jgi:hypothetical protein
MRTTTGQDRNQAILLATRASNKPGEGCRVIHCLVPAAVYRHAKTMAAESDLPFKEFVARVLKNCSPFPLAPEGTRPRPPQTDMEVPLQNAPVGIPSRSNSSPPHGQLLAQDNTHERNLANEPQYDQPSSQ